MNNQWMALLLSTGIAVTACPVPAAQMPPAEQIHGEAEETSVPYSMMILTTEKLRMNSSLTPNHLSQRQTMARPEMKKKIMKPVKKSWIYQP